MPRPASRASARPSHSARINATHRSLRQQRIPRLVSLPLPQGDDVWVPRDTAKRYGHLHWHRRIKGRDYISATIAGRNVYLHRLIMRAPPGKVVHHIDGNPLNCGRKNMVVTTQAINAGIRRKPSTGKTSVYLGVSRGRGSTKYHAQIVVNKIRYSGGWHERELDAARAYDALALLHRGRMARTNFPLP